MLQTWIDPDTGVANNFLDVLKTVSSNTEVVMLLILAVFAASHSGLAYLRPWGKLAPVSSGTSHACQLHHVLSCGHSTPCLLRQNAGWYTYFVQEALAYVVLDHSVLV